MAKTQEVPMDQDVLERVALEIYKDYVFSPARRGIDDEAVVLQSFRKAKIFATVAARIRAGEPIDEVVPDDDGLDFASAPNLKYGTAEWFKFNRGTKRFGRDGKLNVAEQLVAEN